MSFLYGLAFVVGLLILISLNVVKQKATTELYQKLHPPKKQQEEFLKACALYLEYRKDPETHPEPAKDAKRDAAKDIQDQGFLPACLEHLGSPKDQKARLKLFAADRQPAHITYQAIKTVSLTAFRACQAQDQLLSGYSQDKRFWNGATFDPDKWALYCSEMDHSFNQMVDRYLNEVQDASPLEVGPKTDQADLS